MAARLFLHDRTSASGTPRPHRARMASTRCAVNRLAGAISANSAEEPANKADPLSIRGMGLHVKVGHSGF